MKRISALYFVLAAAFLFPAATAQAQVYTWKDPDSGQSRFSNIPPPWYSRGENISGPRVIQTLGGRVVDDTALPYEERLLLSGKSREYIENLRLQKSPAPRQDPARESAATNTQSGNRQSAQIAPMRTEANRKNGG